jgi:hypothetical protein
MAKKVKTFVTELCSPTADEEEKQSLGLTLTEVIAQVRRMTDGDDLVIHCHEEDDDGRTYM